MTSIPPLRRTAPTAVVSGYYSALVGSDEPAAVGKAAEECFRNLEIGGQNRGRRRRQPFGDRDLLIVAAVEGEDDLEFLATGVLDRMAIAHRDITDVAGAKLNHLGPPAGAEDRHVGTALDVVLPFIGIGMPMELAQAPRRQRQACAGHGGRDGEFLHRDVAESATGKLPRLLREQRITVRQHGGIGPAWMRLQRQRPGCYALRNIYLALREIGEGLGWESEGLLQDRARRVANPVGNAEGTEFREMAVVEGQDEQAILGAGAL